MTPEKHFEKFATEFAHEMEKMGVPFMLVVRPNVEEHPSFFVCAGLGTQIDQANMIAKFISQFCKNSNTSVPEMRALVDEVFKIMGY